MPDEPGYDPIGQADARLAAGDECTAMGTGRRPSSGRRRSRWKRWSTTETTAQRPVRGGSSTLKLLHEVFLNPGLFLLFGGIIIGFISRLQGKVSGRCDDSFFVALFQGILCLFLLEMGMTASQQAEGSEDRRLASSPLA